MEKETLELNKWADKVAAIFNHLETIDQAAIMIEALVEKILDMEVTFISAMCIHPNFDKESLW